MARDPTARSIAVPAGSLARGACFLGFDFRELLRCNANGAVDRNAGAG